jgi:hypothetical protein
VAGEPDHVAESTTGHLSRHMLEHDSHSRLLAKKAALDRLDSTSLKPQAQKLNERGVRVLADADRAIATADKYFNALRPTKS